MVSLAGSEQGWVSVPGGASKRSNVVVVDGVPAPASSRGKGGSGWYAGKRKNEKGEIVAIGENGVEIVIMKSESLSFPLLSSPLCCFLSHLISSHSTN